MVCEFPQSALIHKHARAADPEVGELLAVVCHDRELRDEHVAERPQPVPMMLSPGDSMRASASRRMARTGPMPRHRAARHRP